MDFPRFDGVNLRGWLRKCHRYFMLNPMSDMEKILLASMHFEREAEYWYMDNVEGREFMGWTVFSNMLIERFLEGEGENLIGDFNKVVQEDSVEQYREKFEELKSFMSHFNRSLNEEYFLKSFLSGLKEEIRDLVMVQRPATPSQAFHIAKLQESLVNKMKLTSRSAPRTYNPQPLRAIKAPPPEPVLRREVPDNKGTITKRLTNEEIEDSRKRGLCFNFDERYVFGHKCKKIFSVEGMEDPLLNEAEEELNGTGLEEHPHISLTALAGQVNPEIIKVKERVKNNNLAILVDT